MGACDDWVQFDGKLSRTELKEKFKEHQEMLAYENGHSYSGMLNMCDGLDIHDKLFPNWSEAQAYISNNFQKWEAAIAVEYIGVRGQKMWLIGGLCSS